MNVIKRDGSIQEFSFEKVRAVVQKAYNSNNQEVPNEFITQLGKTFDKIIPGKDSMHVEEIQDIIQNELIRRNQYDIVESFIIYRNKRAEIREQNSELIKNITKKLAGSNIENQNANVDEASFGGRIGEAARVVTKNDALKYRMSKKSRKNHENNEIYIHDLDSYSTGMHNCLSVPFDSLLRNGFETRQTDVRSASSVNTAMQLVAVLFQIQSLQQFGGVSATHLDWTMVPYVRKSFKKHWLDGLKFVEDCNGQYSCNGRDNIDSKLSINDEFYKSHPKAYAYALKMVEREVHQAVEGMYHNLNTLQSRSGNQLPFSSINYGTCTLPEGRMVIKALLDVSIEGLGKYGKTSIFPCGIFQYSKDINGLPGTPNYDLYKLALKSTAKRLYPNYANCDWSAQKAWVQYDRNVKKDIISNLDDNDKYRLIERVKENPELGEFLGLSIDGGEIKVSGTQMPIEIFSTMGCRTANGADVNFAKCYEENIHNVINNGEIKYDIQSAAQKDGRGNICPVTIILPTLAMQTKDVEKFMKLLDKKIDEAKDMLIERFNIICSQSPAAAKFMWDNHTMVGYRSDEGVKSAIKHGTLAIGQLGLAETLQILIGKDQTDPEGLEIAKRIEKLFTDKCNEFKKQYSLNFGVYYTPAESLCHTALKKFRDKYGIIPKVSDREYFTNSIHVPVWEEVDPFEKIDIESQLTGYSSAGCITYVELPSSAVNNTEALETIVNYAMDHDIPYFAINLPNDFCEDCGYTGELPSKCPKCGGDHIKRLRRVTGYLSTDYHHFNHGKLCESNDRVKHVKG